MKDCSRVIHISPEQMWDMCTNQVIKVKHNSWSRELVDQANRILKRRKTKLLKELSKIK